MFGHGGALSHEQIDLRARRPQEVVLLRSVSALLASGASGVVPQLSRSCQRSSTAGFSRPMVLSHTISKILVN